MEPQTAEVMNLDNRSRVLRRAHQLRKAAAEILALAERFEESARRESNSELSPELRSCQKPR
jgi:hypothetical protein